MKTINRLAAAAAMAIAISASTGAHAQAMTGNEFYAKCENDGSSWCLGYVFGFAHGIEVLEVSDPGRICLAERINTGQLLDILMAYLRNNPTTRHKEMPLLAVLAFAEAFPCRK